jgi:hypothetical protein
MRNALACPNFLFAHTLFTSQRERGREIIREGGRKKERERKRERKRKRERCRICPEFLFLFLK